MSKLDFARFFEAVHEYPPFPWQVRLAETVVGGGCWPKLLDLPTGVGKTCALDVALFVMAARPDDAPRRVFLVVDRRIIVDQGALHAQKILERLREGAAPEVAERLRALWGGGAGDDPFEVAVLRGGMPRDGDWAKRPDRPVLGLSTVDQVGSRLLFRGYGVSPRMAPVHAGLLGQDTLFLLDEVHLAVPFAQTLNQVQAQPATSGGVQRRLQVVQMSATPGERSGSPYGLGDDDRKNDTIVKRLSAQKMARLEEVPVRGEEATRRQTVGKTAADRAADLLAKGAKVVGVVVNRVDTARAAYRALKENSDLDVVLVTGRMRGLDRAALQDEHTGLMARAGAGRQASDEAKPYVVVATQTIEAGADLDFDGLVTECASYDALKQRFGRLNRRGTQAGSSAFILIRSDQTKDTDEDPIYGQALRQTWEMLSAVGTEVDFGIDARGADDTAGCLAPRQNAPILLPEYLDSWAQTAPVPQPDPDVSLWLHGAATNAPEVQLVWRSEVTEAFLDPTSGPSEDELTNLAAALAACRPAPAEALSVPMYAARAWLQDGSESAVSDMVGADVEDKKSGGRAKYPNARQALRWTGGEVQVVGAGDIRAGDTLLVPCAWGGIYADNWDPSAKAPVSDLGDMAQAAAHRRPTLRLRPVPLMQLGLPDGIAATAPQHEEDGEVLPEDLAQEWLDEVLARPDISDEVRESLQSFANKPEVVRLADGSLVLIGSINDSRRTAEASTEDDDSAFTNKEQTLREHSEDVRTWAEHFVAHLGLPKTIAEDICLAAYFHDVGKADPRFQRWLRGGAAVGRPELLAKSGASSRSRGAREQARLRSGYPKGERHELLSAALLEQSESALAGAHDRELVLHLVASHHGWCRPFAPALDAEADVEVSVELGGVELVGSARHGAASISSGVEARFWNLNARYGHWGLAWLEAVVRLADHRASEGGKPCQS